MHQLKNQSVTRATPRKILMAIGLYLVSLVALQLSDAQIAAFAPQMTKPDLRFGYDYTEVLAVLTALGEGGRSAYGLNLVIDSVMPVLFAMATVLVVIRLLPRWAGVLSVAPIAFLVLDLVENILFAVMLAQYPDISPALVATASPITMVKLSSFAIALPTLILGGIALGLRGLLGRRRDRIRTR